MVQTVDFMLTTEDASVVKAVLGWYHDAKDDGFIDDVKVHFPWSTPQIIIEALNSGRKELETAVEMEKVLEAHADELENE